MKGLKRITLVILVLVGSVALFGYWSINQFNQAFDNLSAAYLADTSTAYLTLKQKAESASTSPEISGEIATSTGTSTKPITSTDPELTLAFPQKETKVYIGCTYPISWQASGLITSMEAALVDAGTKEALGPKTSGLAKENTVKEDLQNLTWKVGSVWPGAYYIKISKINDFETETRSKVFLVNKLSENLNESEQKDICEKSGGLF